ncbi:hypothetical protein KIN20_018959 [Parelaphostrongylus tenuis]|uniref:Uncharacterized protein n=1 Tax=Parelaphostrongylus tenuis TaxID=148309 RepID=A0AAD5MK67_PARTN|nr:hypothetical protein KIN20_018959 [Parelaphostrongylus tenuis]
MRTEVTPCVLKMPVDPGIRTFATGPLLSALSLLCTELSKVYSLAAGKCTKKQVVLAFEMQALSAVMEMGEVLSAGLQVSVTES